MDEGGGRLASTNTGINDEDSHIRQEDYREMITDTDDDRGVAEETQMAGNEADTQCQPKDTTLDETVVGVPVAEDGAEGGGTSSIITPIIIISAPDGHLVFNSQPQNAMKDEEQGDAIHAQVPYSSSCTTETSIDEQVFTDTSSEGSVDSQDSIVEYHDKEDLVGESTKHIQNSSDGTTDQIEGGSQESNTESDKTEYKGEAGAEEQENYTEELSMILSQQHTLTEGMSEESWEFLNQLSMQNKQGNGEETKNKRAGSPVSDIDESGENDITTYLNYIQDDDICLVGPVVTAESDDPITVEDPTPLETISEQDESDDEGDGVDGGMSALRLKSKLSAGMYNLNTIAEDGGEDFLQWDEEYAAEPGLPSIKEIPSDPAESDRSSGEEQEVSTGEKEEEATKEKVRMRSKRGRVLKEKKANPIFLSENLRTFSNPISYLGGPSIEYVDEEDGQRRTDSIGSTTSLD